MSTNFRYGIQSRGVPLYGSGFGPPFGIGTGEIFYVVTARSSNLYYDKLISNGIKDSEIYTAVSDAYNATIANQNDVVVVTPGAYAETASISWSNAQTHLVGLGGPNPLGDYSEPNVVLYTATASVAQVLDITGQNCMFLNMNVENSGANAANVAAVKVNKYGCYFENCRIAGNMVSAQNASANTCSLWIAEAGMYPIFNSCQIGQDVWGNRTTANGGVIKYETTSGESAGRPNGTDFNDCRIISVGDDASCVMIRVTASTAIGRGHRFNNCFFQHWDGSGAGATTLTSAVYTPSTGVQKHIIMMHNCSALGIDEWQTDDDSVVMGYNPISGTGGGLARNLVGTVGQ